MKMYILSCITGPILLAASLAGADSVAQPKPALIFQKVCLNTNSGSPAEHLSETGWAYIKVHPSYEVDFFAAVTRSPDPATVVSTDLKEADVYWSGHGDSTTCAPGSAPFALDCKMKEKVGYVSNPSQETETLVTWRSRPAANGAFATPINFGAGTLGLPTDDTFVCVFVPAKRSDCLAVYGAFKRWEARGLGPKDFRFAPKREACPL